MMNRASFGERIWYKTLVPVFLERFILPALATVLIGVILLNPLKFDWQRQVSLAIAVVALAYFVGRTVQAHNETRNSNKAPGATEQQSTPPQTPLHVSGPATTSGEGSPAVTGDGNTITYGADGKKVAPKDKSK
jgi:hypothetical protein